MYHALIDGVHDVHVLKTSPHSFSTCRDKVHISLNHKSAHLLSIGLKNLISNAHVYIWQFQLFLSYDC